MTILDLLQHDGIIGKKVASTNGGEYASPCPGCGGEDRFRCWPEEGDGGRWWCRHCNKSGDVIQYLREFKGMSYRDACIFLGRTPGRWRTLRHKRQAENYTWMPKDRSRPPEQWQENAMQIVESAEQCLWSDEGSRMREWLAGRGLKEQSIKQALLGLILKDQWFERAHWGLPEEAAGNGHKKLWIPEGLVIPCVSNRCVQRIRIRSSNPCQSGKYYIVPGSSSSPLVCATKECMLVVESELDALLVNQEAGDLVGVVALGSAQVKPDNQTSEMLHRARIILVSLDNDESGAKTFWEWWVKNFPNTKRWPVIEGKDPSEAYQNGLDIRAWVLAGLPFIECKETATSEPAEERPEHDEKYQGSIQYSLIRDQQSLQEAADQLKDSEVLGLDTETTGLDPHIHKIRLLQLAAPGLPVFVVDLWQIPQDGLTPLREVLNGPVTKVFHNAKFDLKFLQKADLQVKGSIFDTMTAAQLLTLGLKKKGFTLADLVKNYLGKTLPKEEQTSDWGAQLTAVQLEYAARDAAVLLKLWEVLSAQLEIKRLEEAAELESGCLPAVVEMELNGMLMDKARLEVLHKDLMLKKREVESSLQEKLGMM
ncbi:MAG: hypothetical protein JRI22_19805 [Deltaproteobacteria bacterium]|nr:hypothetical protein [Deltaproteobacteria bacterium]